MKELLMLLLIVMVAGTSCTKHLSRSDALKMIVDNQNYPIIKNYEIVKSYIKDMDTKGRGVTIVVGEDEFESQENAIHLFKEKGLLDLKEVPHQETVSNFLLGTTTRTWKTVHVSLTASGKKYMTQETENSYLVRLWEIDVQEISGIQELKEYNAAEVDYTITNKNITPFGDIFGDKNNVTEKSAYFSLYDDGWRISN